MSNQPIVANPIGWIQVRLLGGWKRLLGFAGGYAGLVILLHLFIFRAAGFDTASLPTFVSAALYFMDLCLVANFLFGSALAIKKALHRDFTTDLINSHRMTATSGYSAVLGYVTGPTVQTVLVTLVNWIICAVLALMAGPTAPTLSPNGIMAALICLAAMLWPLAVLVGLCTRGRTSIVGVIVILGVSLKLPVLHLLPGLELLIRAEIAGLDALITNAGAVDVFIIISLAAQIAFGLIFFLAAARKFARDDVLAFTPPLAYVLLALCTLLSALGLAFVEPVSSSGLAAMMPSDYTVPLLATLPLLGLIAFLPVSIAAKNSARWSRCIVEDPTCRRAKPRSFIEAPFAATFLVFAITLVILAPHLDRFGEMVSVHDAAYRFAWIVTTFLLMLLAVAGLLRSVYAYTEKGAWAIIIYLLFVWILPPLIDLAIKIGLDDFSAASTPLLGCSPAGTWLIVSGRTEGSLIPGFIFQMALAAGALWLAYRTRQRERRARPMVASPAATS